MVKWSRQTIVYLTVLHGLVHILELTFGVIRIGIATEFDTGLFVFGIMANILGFAFGATALPSGYLADHMSERRLLMLGGLGMGIAAVAIGMAPNIYVMGMALFALGVSLGVFHPVASALVARTAPQRGRGFGYFGIGGNLGVALGPIIAGGIAAALGWRASYLIMAAPALIIAALFYRTARTEAPPPAQSSPSADPSPFSVRSVLPLLILLFSAQVVNGFVYRGIVTFLPSYLADRMNLGFLNLEYLLRAGSLTSIALLFGVGGILLGGYLSDRKRPEIIAVVIALINTPLLVLMGYGTGLTLIAGTSAFAFVHFMGQPVYNMLVAEYSPDNWRGRMFGISFFCLFGVGSFAGSLLGYFAERLDSSWIFWILAGFQLLALLLAVTLMVKAHRHRNRLMSYPGQSPVPIA